MFRATTWFSVTTRRLAMDNSSPTASLNASVSLREIRRRSNLGEQVVSQRNRSPSRLGSALDFSAASACATRPHPGPPVRVDSRYLRRQDQDGCDLERIRPPCRTGRLGSPTHLVELIALPSDRYDDQVDTPARFLAWTKGRAIIGVLGSTLGTRGGDRAARAILSCSVSNPRRLSRMSQMDGHPPIDR
jgi:hypothetical protein